MTSQASPTRLTKMQTWNAVDDPDTLRFTLRLMLDLHGPAAVINYARDHGISCRTCCACGWVPHLDEECLICEGAMP